MAQDYVQKPTSIFSVLNVHIMPLGNYLDRYLVKSSCCVIRIDLVTSVNFAATVSYLHSLKANIPLMIDGEILLSLPR